MDNHSTMKSKAEQIVDDQMTESLRKLGSTTSIDGDYDLIKEVLREEEELKEKPITQAWKPNLDKYPDAVIDVDGVGAHLVPNIGEKIAIEFPDEWRDTVYGEIKYIDPETGIFRIWNERMRYHTMSNFKEGRELGLTFKMAPKNIAGLRSRKKKLVSLSPIVEQDTSGQKRGRGRPKGSKNRPKDVIQAEKKAHEEAKKRKVEKRAIREKIRSMRGK